MEKDEIFRLKLRRQFYLTPEPFSLDGDFKTVKVHESYYLNYHKDLHYSEAGKDGRKLFILGNLFDPFHPDYSNQDIARNLADYAFNELLRKCDIYAGRYVIIYSDHDSLKLFHDFMSHLKVYWTIHEEMVYCGSQPHILAKHLNIRKSTDPERVEFFNSNMFTEFEYMDILKYTLFESIEHLQPNHYLDLIRNRSVRYWPQEVISRAKTKDIVRRGTTLLKGYLKGIANRYKLMIPVTAGHESRLLFAASREISDQCYYYVNKVSSFNDKSADLQIPKKMLYSLGLKFHILEYPATVDPDFEKVYKENCQSPTQSRLALIYNVFYTRFQNYINVPGNGAEIFVSGWKVHFRNDITAIQIVHLFHFDPNPFLIKVLDEWLKEIRPLSKQFNIDVANFFYLEFRMANWGTNYQTNKEIAQDEVYPFNSRMMIIELLSARSYYRQVKTRLIEVKMMKYLWKETVSFPFNPSVKNYLKQFLEKAGLYGIASRNFIKKP